MSNEYSDFTTIPSRGYFLVVKARKGDNWVILKGLKEQFREAQRLQNLLRKEYKMAHELDHPNIAKYIGYIDTDNFGKCIVEEYIEGRTLKDYLQEEHTEDEKLRIIGQIASALGYLRQNNITHNNLTTKNILITKNGDQVKLIDFRAEYQDDLHEPVSTLKFLSPELKDGTVTPDGRSDIYSLGMIMKEMNLPLYYEPIIKKCTGYGRNDRYYDTSELMNALEHGEHSEGSHKSLILGVLIAIAAIVIAVVIFTSTGKSESQAIEAADSIHTEQAEEQQAAAEHPAETTQPQPSLQQPTADPNEDPFISQIKPALYKDLDNIFQPYLDGTKTAGLSRQIKAYYKGLMKANAGITPEQRSALDKVFGDYVAQKKAQLK